MKQIFINLFYYDRNSNTFLHLCLLTEIIFISNFVFKLIVLNDRSFHYLKIDFPLIDLKSVRVLFWACYPSTLLIQICQFVDIFISLSFKL